MQTISALPPSAAVLMAADRVIGSWKDGKATLREAAFILTLAEAPGGSLTDYSGRLGVSTPVLCRMVENFYVAGLCTRITDPADRRRIIIRPTSHGERLARVLSGRGA